MSKSLKQLLQSLSAHPVINPKILYRDYVSIDLSVKNKALKTVDVSSSEVIEQFIHKLLQTHYGKVAFGGYNETRAIYQHRDSYNQGNSETERKIHLGLDLWVASGTSVHSPLEATVHSFKNNNNVGDYGPTIILKHEINTVTFYTLYGHLSTDSLKDLQVGQTFKKGQQIATLGETEENGNYPPHLHFQIIKDIQDYHGDYPGVSSKQDLAFYLENCPNPEWFLKLN